MPDHGEHHVEHGYERRDFIERRGVVGFVVTLGLSVIACFIICFYLLKFLESQATPPADSNPEAPAVAEGPRLQPHPSAEMRVLERRNASIEQYGWVDRDSGVVRIPIERAIELTAEKGLPAREATGAR
jgi:hypothetical protein